MDSTLGNGTNVNSNVPTQASVLTNVTAVSAGLYHAFAVKTDGTVWAWGQNYAGEYGNGNNTLSGTPVLTNFTGITAVACGGSFSVALKNDGTVWTSGWNSHGQLGNGNHTDMNVPQQVLNLSGITAIAAGKGLWHGSEK